MLPIFCGILLLEYFKQPKFNLEVKNHAEQITPGKNKYESKPSQEWSEAE